jgi:alpha(1,3/1,4) fucosyltransferase
MLREISFYYHRTTKCIKESCIYCYQSLRDTLRRQGEDADIRVLYNGYSSKNLKDAEEKDWFFSYIRETTGKKLTVSWYKPSLIICSSFGSYWLLKLILKTHTCPSLFYSEENLSTLKKYREYRDYLDGLPTLAMGFDYRNEKNYRRFPLWLEYLFTPEFAAKASVDEIQAVLNEIENRSLLPKKHFAAMIASHDGYNSPKKIIDYSVPVSRSIITSALEQIGFVHCPGKLNHNDDSLQLMYADDKKAYLKQFVFNICAENASVQGYVTEKLLESFEAGAIPVYWGDPNPEPEILNPKRIIFWNDRKGNEATLDLIQTLYHSQEERDNFFEESIFTPQAAQKIYEHFSLLRRDIDELLTVENTR